jgi:hypothetical protein
MNVNSENLRLVLGFKLKQYRLEKGLSLKELANKTQLSISYLSEIEKGKKYPKPEKILQLAEALEVPFDDLVSLQLHKDLDPLPVVFGSPVIKEFPFKMYGVSPQELLSLITVDPEKSGALIRTFLEIGQDYNMRVEHLLLAALRSYKKMHLNYFPELEKHAQLCREKLQLPKGVGAVKDVLSRFLEKHHNYRIDEQTLSAFAGLEEVEFVVIPGKSPKLLINNALPEKEKCFLLAREVGYCQLNIQERPYYQLKMLSSFDQLLNAFKAGYFAAALLMPESDFVADFKMLSASKRWDSAKWMSVLEQYAIPPSVILNRWTSLLPRHFQIRKLIFFCMHHERQTERFHLTQLFNLTDLKIPNGVGSREHYCRRWMSIKLLNQLKHLPDSERAGLLIGAQCSKIINLDEEMFTISIAMPDPLRKGCDVGLTLGMMMDDHFKQQFHFWTDPQIPRADVNETCERCNLQLQQCSDRVATASVFECEQRFAAQEKAIGELIKKLSTK